MTVLLTGLIRTNFTRRLTRMSKEVETDGSMQPPAVVAVPLLMWIGSEFSEILSSLRDNVDRTVGEPRRRDAKAGRVRAAEGDLRKPP